MRLAFGSGLAGVLAPRLSPSMEASAATPMPEADFPKKWRRLTRSWDWEKGSCMARFRLLVKVAWRQDGGDEIVSKLARFGVGDR